MRFAGSAGLCVVLAGCAGTGGLGVDTPVINSTVDSAVAAPGAGLPFGQIEMTCDVAASSLGRPVVTASGYTVYDTDPTSTAPRAHYVDGFTDGCLRQFTAALVLMGDVTTHEGVRYQTDNTRPYSPTDTAYEQIKAAFCGAASGAPCGARIDALGERTVFVTAYPSFSGSDNWVEYLLHAGVVAGSGTER
ncbi:hypothetical protein SAMN04488003_10814 [Loktanella fryxellensis]|uniref:Uncharacterized protein n=1 Tax=Loktanella fryxellensis TaxID=245187 RepID=A0A1H8D5B8_9RHOB|nr:hypothetical protein [Loktanella fryxellensis]SEN02382.1 hypothetical protein SAMN04488003_10814 [Loktanella fryxellensis]